MQLFEPGEEEMQHAPVAGGQVLLPQTVPGPRKCPPWATQAVCDAMTQEPSWRQQAP